MTNFILLSQSKCIEYIEKRKKEIKRLIFLIVKIFNQNILEHCYLN